MQLPKDLKYAKSHEWARVSGKTAVVGITAFAVEQLRDLVYLDLPKVGSFVKAGEPFGEIESVKAVSDLVAPVGGKIVKVNAELADHLERLNSDPYGTGWMVEVEMSNPQEAAQLLDASAYERHAAADHH